MKVKFCKKAEPSANYFVILLVKMKVLKNYRNIFSALLLIFMINLGFAGTFTNGQEAKPQEQQEGRRKSDQTMIRPDGEYTSPATQADYQEEVREEPRESEEYEKPQVKADSIEDDSVSKYNFIFYFLYKFKYDTEESP
ncbi:hypothetical protein [Ekhidna sp.]|uniref:hypothetical protein n=1 Tax=Ekhidna sp. TaxID=2608089 RepID=UPI003C7EC59F